MRGAGREEIRRARAARAEALRAALEPGKAMAGGGFVGGHGGAPLPGVRGQAGGGGHTPLRLVRRKEGRARGKGGKR